MREDFFSAYLAYTSNNESPSVFHRWSAIAAIGAMLGRNYSQEFGHNHIAPNIYCMLLGSPGTRKSTAVKMAKKLLIQVGYDTFAADKSTKEKFLLDLAGFTDTGLKSAEEFLATPIDEEYGHDSTESREVFIAADEFNDFFGNNILEFVALLGNLWDYEGIFRNRIKNGQSVVIPNPTVSILGGNTPTGFKSVFPPEVIGQGFFSRVLLIHGERTREGIAFPKPPSELDTKIILELFTDFKVYCHGPAVREPNAEALLEKIYHNWHGVPDNRFDYYGNRRFTHLLKLCSIHAAARAVADRDKTPRITLADVVTANTVLTAAEFGMPKALGEFGMAKTSDVAQKILDILEKSNKPVEFKELYSQLHRDIGAIRDFAPVLQSLLAAEKVQQCEGGYLPVRLKPRPLYMEGIDWSYLTDEERMFIPER